MYPILSNSREETDQYFKVLILFFEKKKQPDNLTHILHVGLDWVVNLIWAIRVTNLNNPKIWIQLRMSPDPITPLMKIYIQLETTQPTYSTQPTNLDYQHVGKT